MMNSTSTTDVDEIIETEVCNRLIRLSCAKMVNSKHERGGAKLHRNLLILHLLRRARNEQKRFPSSSPEGMMSSPDSSYMPTQVVVEPSPVNFSAEEDEDDAVGSDEDEEKDDIEGKSKIGNGQLLDLSSCRTNLSPSVVVDPVEFSVRDEDDIDCSTLRLEPLQLPFATDAIEAEELSETSKSSLLVVPDLSPELPLISCPEPAVKNDDDQPPSLFVASEDEQSSSGSDEDDEDSEAPLQIPQRRRKRKTSAPRVLPPCNPKKCCVEERQLTGLISVFNSGLSVVADQFLPRSTVGSPLLQQANDQLVPSLVCITCNPLICK